MASEKSLPDSSGLHCPLPVKLGSSGSSWPEVPFTPVPQQPSSPGMVSEQLSKWRSDSVPSYRGAVGVWPAPAGRYQVMDPDCHWPLLAGQ